MKLKLYSTGLPSGNAVTLARALSKATGIGATEAIQVAMKLYGGIYSSDLPLELAITEHSNVGDLVDRCNESGIQIAAHEEL